MTTSLRDANLTALTVFFLVQYIVQFLGYLQVV